MRDAKRILDQVKQLIGGSWCRKGGGAVQFRLGDDDIVCKPPKMEDDLWEIEVNSRTTLAVSSHPNLVAAALKTAVQERRQEVLWEGKIDPESREEFRVIRDSQGNIRAQTCAGRPDEWAEASEADYVDALAACIESLRPRA